MVVIGGEIKLAEYAASGSDTLTRNVIAALEDRNAVLLTNHGMLGVGKDLREAFTVCELVEKIAKVVCLCQTLGRINLLPEETVKSGRALFKKLHS